MSGYTFGKQVQIHNLGKLYEKYLGQKTDGVFVEVGAFDCYHWSNTFGLARLGWKGLYFEPQLKQYQKCVERFKQYQNIEMVHMALSDWQGETELHLGGSLSTINEEQKQLYLLEDWSRGTGLAAGKTETVQVSTLAHELSKRSWPASYDLLVVDVEGSEVDVLKGNDIESFRPTMAIVETHAKLDSSLAAKAEFIDNYFYAHGYGLVQEDHINSIYVYEK